MVSMDNGPAHRWQWVAVGTSFMAVAGWSAVLPLITQFIKPGAAPLFMASTFGIAIAAVAIPAMSIPFLADLWAKVLLVGMWAFLLLIAFGSAGGRNASWLTEYLLQPTVAGSSVVQFSNGDEVTRMEVALWPFDAAAYAKLYCTLTAGSNKALFQQALNDIVKPGMGNVEMLALAAARTPTLPGYDANASCAPQ